MKLLKIAQVREYQFDNDKNRYWEVLEIGIKHIRLQR
jgi:hypothetical protein